MKKLLAAMAMLLLLAAPLSVAAVGGTATITAAEEVAPGETITFTVTICDAEPVRAVMIAPVYDAAAFELVEGTFLRTGLMSDFGEKDGVIAWSSPTDINGGLATFTLRAKDTAEIGKSYEIGCEYTIQDADEQRGVGNAIGWTVTVLGEHTPTEEHVYDNPCDTDCNVCGATRDTAHIYGDTWVADDTDHWKVCANCQAQGQKANHSPADDPTLCATCQQPLSADPGHTHSYAENWASDEGGHWHTCSCGSTIDLGSHNWSKPIEADGVLRATCTVCGAQQDEPISQPTTTQPTQSGATSSSQPKKPFDVWAMVAVGAVLLGGSAVTVWLLRKKNT